MCQWISGEAVFIDECEVAVKVSMKTDSHREIRAEHGIAEDNGGPMAARHTPVDLIPHGDLCDPEHSEFVFDADRPAWWTEGHTASAVRQLSAAMIARKELTEFVGSIEAPCATKIDCPALQKVGGYIYAPCATQINWPALQKVGTYIYAPAATKIDLPALQSVGIYIYAPAATQIDLPALQTVGVGIYARDATQIDWPALQTVEGDIYAPSATKIDRWITLAEFRDFEAAKEKP